MPRHADMEMSISEYNKGYELWKEGVREQKRNSTTIEFKTMSKSSTYKFKTTNIRGKQYVEVNERIKFFRQEEQYKGWSITTRIEHMTDTDVIMRTTILNADGRDVATGYAQEVKGSSNINKTSHIENCETSAVGRALAMLGIGIETSIASANEVNGAIAMQEDKAPKPKPKAKSAAKPASVEKDNGQDYDKAVTYLKNATDVADAWGKIQKQALSKFTPEQYDRLVNFVKGKQTPTS